MFDFIAFLQPGLTVLGFVLAGLFFWHAKDVPSRGFGWLGISLTFYVLNRTIQPSLFPGLPTIYGRSIFTILAAAVAIAAFLMGLAIYSERWRDRRAIETSALFAGVAILIAMFLLAFSRPDIALVHFVPAMVMGVASALQWQAFRDSGDRGYLLLVVILSSHPLLWLFGILSGQPGMLIQQLLSIHYVMTCTVILSVVLRRSRVQLTNAIDDLTELNATLEERIADRERKIKEVQEKITQAAVERSKVDAREQLLAELHEGLGSSLSMARVRLASGQVAAEEVSEILDQCFTDLHLIIDTLNEHSESLQSALVDYRWRCERRLYGISQKIDWQLEVADAPELDPRSRLNVLRIVQEALSNALKHSAATRISIRAHHRPGEGVRIDIEDDGCGLDPQANTGSGLRNMQKRARNIGGTLRIENRLDRSGTRVELCVPVGS